jgi:RNA polymerase sigma-70 factor (ECF subfamily)
MALAEHVRSAMQRLHPTERLSVELAYFGGRTYREVAAELGEPEGTVKSRIRSGLKRLRTELVLAGVNVGDV